MMNPFEVQLPEGRTLFQIIGWFSLCMIVAGWGPAIDVPIRNAWAFAGVAGIGAALVLEGTFRRRQSQDFGQQPFGVDACMKHGI